CGIDSDYFFCERLRRICFPSVSKRFRYFAQLLIKERRDFLYPSCAFSFRLLYIRIENRFELFLEFFRLYLSFSVILQGISLLRHRAVLLENVQYIVRLSSVTQAHVAVEQDIITCFRQINITSCENLSDVDRLLTHADHLRFQKRIPRITPTCSSR